MPFVAEAPVAKTGRFVPEEAPVVSDTPGMNFPRGQPKPLDPILEASRGVMAYQTPETLKVPSAFKDIALEGGGATAGQVAGAYVAPYTLGLSIPVGGAIGGGIGNALAQRRRIAAGEQDKFKIGELLSSTALSAIPGGGLGSSGVKAIAREGVKQGAAGLAAKTGETLIDEGRLPTGKEALFATALPAIGGSIAQKIQSANPEIQRAVAAAEAATPVKNKTLEAAQKLGFVAPPSLVRKEQSDLGTKVLSQADSMGGKAALDQATQIKNSKIAKQAVNSELGLPENSEITMKTLREIRKEEGQTYAEIEKMASEASGKVKTIERERFTAADPHELAIQKNEPATVAELTPLTTQAKADLQALRETRGKADAAFESYRNGNASALDVALNARKEAEQLEDQVEAAVRASGKPELADKLRASRTRIAKTYSVEEALGLGDAGIDPTVFAKQLDRGVPLTGKLETIAKFAAAFPTAVRDAARVPAPGVSKLNLPFAMAVGGGTYGATQNPVVAGAGALASMVTPGLARSTILSKPYQNAFARLPAPTPDVTPDKLAAAIRLLSQAAGGEK